MQLFLQALPLKELNEYAHLGRQINTYRGPSKQRSFWKGVLGVRDKALGCTEASLKQRCPLLQGRLACTGVRVCVLKRDR